MSWSKAGCLSQWPRSEWPLVSSSTQPFVTIISPFRLNARRKHCDVTSTVYCQVQSSCWFVSGDKQMRFDSFMCLLMTLTHIDDKLLSCVFVAAAKSVLFSSLFLFFSDFSPTTVQVSCCMSRYDRSAPCSFFCFTMMHYLQRSPEAFCKTKVPRGIAANL